jgi:glutaconate CoA-transferase, subunit B
MMTVAAARALKNDDVCFVGIGAPSAACNLARLTHAPDITLIYESGTIGTKPTCCRCRSATANSARRR